MSSSVFASSDAGVPDGPIEWGATAGARLGIGSVEGRLVSGDPRAPGPKASLRLSRGIPGHELPGLATATLAVRRGDMLLFATDGIGAGFADSLDVSGRPRDVAERVLAAHRKGTDEALVLTARYLGPRR